MTTPPFMTMPPPSLGFLFDSVGGIELLLFLAIVLILFGPRRLPEVARQVGRWTRTLRQVSQDFKDQVMRAAQNELPDEPPAGLPPAASGDDPAADKEGDERAG